MENQTAHLWKNWRKMLNEEAIPSPASTAMNPTVQAQQAKVANTDPTQQVDPRKQKQVDSLKQQIRQIESQIAPLADKKRKLEDQIAKIIKN